jgi:hypothetical protein
VRGSLIGNQTTSPDQGAGGGAALREGTSGWNAVTVSANTSRLGGGVFFRDGALMIVNGAVSDNVATSQGGGLMVYAGLATTDRTRWTGNAAVDGGAVFVRADATLEVLAAVFQSNSPDDVRSGQSYTWAVATTTCDGVVCAP